MCASFYSAAGLFEDCAGEPGQTDRVLRHWVCKRRPRPMQCWHGVRSRGEDGESSRCWCSHVLKCRRRHWRRFWFRTENRVQGFLAAGHVCTVMGYNEYLPISARRYKVPIVVTGFEPLDILEGRSDADPGSLRKGAAMVENQYLAHSGSGLAICPAQNLIGKVFEVGDRKWRGIGTIPLKRRIGCVRSLPRTMRRSCSTLLRSLRWSRRSASADRFCAGIKKPGHDCPAFGTLCNPQHPLAARLWWVGRRRACAAYYCLRAASETAGSRCASTRLRRCRWRRAQHLPMEDARKLWRPRKDTKSEKQIEAEVAVSPLFGSCPIPIYEHKQIVLGTVGSGGKLTGR